MKFFAVLLGCALLGLAGPVSAADLLVDETSDDEGDVHKRCFGISAQLNPDEVLVVGGTRWENGAKVLEIEEVWSGPGWVIKLAEPAPNYWHVTEPAAEQHLQGVALARLERSASGLELELAPVSGGARRTYVFRWRAVVELWSAVNGRHPDLPARAASAGWPYRQILFPVSVAGKR